MNLPVTGLRVGVLGATSPVGQHLVRRLGEAGAEPLAFDRRRVAAQLLPLAKKSATFASLPVDEIPIWVSAAPLWVVPPLLPSLLAHGAKRLVALSSTSLLTKAASPDPAERAVAAQLAQAETAVITWAGAHALACTLLRRR